MAEPAIIGDKRKSPEPWVRHYAELDRKQKLSDDVRLAIEKLSPSEVTQLITQRVTEVTKVFPRLKAKFPDLIEWLPEPQTLKLYDPLRWEDDDKGVHDEDLSAWFIVHLGNLYCKLTYPRELTKEEVAESSQYRLVYDPISNWLWLEGVVKPDPLSLDLCDDLPRLVSETLARDEVRATRQEYLLYAEDWRKRCRLDPEWKPFVDTSPAARQELEKHSPLEVCQLIADRVAHLEQKVFPRLQTEDKSVEWFPKPRVIQVEEGDPDDEDNWADEEHPRAPFFLLHLADVHVRHQREDYRFYSRYKVEFSPLTNQISICGSYPVDVDQAASFATTTLQAFFDAHPDARRSRKEVYKKFLDKP